MSDCDWCHAAPAVGEWTELADEPGGDGRPVSLCAVCGPAILDPGGHLEDSREGTGGLGTEAPGAIAGIDRRLHEIWKVGGIDGCWSCRRPVGDSHPLTGVQMIMYDGDEGDEILYEDPVLCFTCAGLHGLTGRFSDEDDLAWDAAQNAIRIIWLERRET